MPHLPEHISWDESFYLSHPELSPSALQQEADRKALQARLNALQGKACFLTGAFLSDRAPYFCWNRIDRQASLDGFDPDNGDPDTGFRSEVMINP